MGRHGDSRLRGGIDLRWKPGAGASELKIGGIEELVPRALKEVRRELRIIAAEVQQDEYLLPGRPASDGHEVMMIDHADVHF